jgi:N-acetylglutamate synthase
MRYRLELRLTAGDIGKRVVLRWRRPAARGGEEMADVLGILEAVGQESFTVRKSSGEVVVIPRALALGGKTVPPTPRRGRPA